MNPAESGEPSPSSAAERLSNFVSSSRTHSGQRAASPDSTFGRRDPKRSCISGDHARQRRDPQAERAVSRLHRERRMPEEEERQHHWPGTLHPTCHERRVPEGRELHRKGEGRTRLRSEPMMGREIGLAELLIGRASDDYVHV